MLNKSLIRRWCPLLLIGVSVIALACESYVAPRTTPPRLSAPVFGPVNLSEAKYGDTYHEAIKLTWTPPATDSNDIRSFTILRKKDGDSIYDVFYHSDKIPDSITTFLDDIKLSGIAFVPTSYVNVYYRMFAVDTLARRSDTSAPCSLSLAPQPVFDRLDTTRNWCFNWTSRHIQGSVRSLITIWDSTHTVRWTSPATEEFGEENRITPFRACVPDTLQRLHSGTWFRAIYLEANGSEYQSLTVEPFNVR
ncbi:MAG: hypothetical protein MUF22_06335 [Chitinispirillaceae bacterium]|jgi:hypothetical protein|nr:hypothetical protein [Chitinispirillaceae bacterium]